MDAERDALITLVRAADGRATIEPVTMLGVALLSPWSGDRRDFKDRPNRIAPRQDARSLLEFLDEVRPTLSDRRLPTDRGFLPWLRYRGLAVPVAELNHIPTSRELVDHIPSWLTDPALADALICLPPAAGYPQAAITNTVIEVDGRVAALHLLITQVADSPYPTTAVPRDAVTRILEWFVGPRAVHWSAIAAEQCHRMRPEQTAGNRAWHRSFIAAQVEPVRARITRAVPLVPENWRVPPPTAAERDRRRILAEGRAALKARETRRVPATG